MLKTIQKVVKLADIKSNEFWTKPVDGKIGVWKVDERLLVMVGTELARGFIDGANPGHMRIVVNRDFMNPRWVPVPTNAQAFVEALPEVFDEEEEYFKLLMVRSEAAKPKTSKKKAKVTSSKVTKPKEESSEDVLDELITG